MWRNLPQFETVDEVLSKFGGITSQSLRQLPEGNILDKGNHMGPVARGKTMRRAGVAGTRRTRQGGVS